MSKGSREPRHASNRQKDIGIKSFGLTNKSSKSLAQTEVCMCGEKLVKELQPPVMTPTIKHGGASVIVWRFLPIAKLGIRIESDRLSQNTAASCDQVWNVVCESRVSIHVR